MQPPAIREGRDWRDASQVTISAPFIHAACLELLADRIEAEGSRVLDVGCGSGILLAYIARMARPSATVVGVEVVQRLVDTSRSNLERDGFCLREPRPVGCCRIEVLQGDGWDGVAELGPFDAINVGAGAPRIPEELVRQLKPGGALVVPVGKEQANQVLTLVVKHPGAGLEETKVAFPPVRFVPLVGGGPAAQPPGPRPCLGPGKPETSVDTAGGGVDWNARYRKGWAYGKEPSRFLAEAAELHLRPLLQRARAGSRGSEGEAPGLRILSLGEGQGRNAVHLASSLPGLHCVGVDSSSVGLSKARRLAKQRGVAASLTTVVADLTTYEPDTGAFDAVISIFCVLPPRQRKALHQRCAQALRPGGVVVVECFSLGQQELWVQGRPWQLGPPADQMVSWEQLAGDFEGLSVEVGEEVSEELAEGPFHRGPARLTRFVAFKPENDIMDSKLPVSLSADARSHGQEGVSPSSVNMEASPLCDLGVVRALECSGSFICSAVQEVFNEAAVGGPAALPPRPSSGPRDWLLSYAGWSVRAACREAERAGWCRGCWVPSHLCLCRSITSAIWESVSRLPSPSSRHGICRAARRGVSLRWVILLHPGEFLRSTSTARIAAPCLAALGFNAELLVLGSKAHEHRLGKVLKAAAAGTPTFMMFPGLDEKRFGIGEQLDDAIKIIPAAGGCHEISAPPAVTSVPEMLRHAGLAGMDPLGGKEVRAETWNPCCIGIR